MRVSSLGLLALIPLLWSEFTAAALIRYDVTMASITPGDADASGYMLFQDPVNGGDIMPYLVDWLFHDPLPDELTFDATNSVAGSTNEFVVDALGNYVSDNILCFGIEDACEGALAKGEVILSGSGVTIFTHPGGSPIQLYDTPFFSNPVEVALPGIQLLFGIALANLFFRKRRRAR